MRKGICQLCDKEKDLAESHIIPKFVYRWMKQTGGKYFRTALNPNQRLQDGIKNYLLCFDCEQKFSKYEKWFADNIFFPHLKNSSKFLEYDENLGNFIISVLWRRLLLNKINGQEYFEKVFNDWKSYLNNEDVLQNDKIHLFFLGDIWGENTQPNEFVHRYFTRATDTNIAEIDNDIIVFAKFSRFLVFAELNINKQNFRGTNVYFGKSKFPFAQYIDNGKISLYFLDRAEKIYRLALSRISEEEQVKILTEINKNPENFWDSDAGKSVSSDINSEIRPYKVDERIKYVCDICLDSMREPEGHLLRTYEIVISEKYWKYIFSNNNFGIDKEGLKKRLDYFIEVSSSPTPWIICDKCISMFDIKDIEKNKAYMNKWFSTKGKFRPNKCGDFRNYLDNDEIKKIPEMIAGIN
ncbi:hypothetical protein [Flavobacterium soli]|uniref:hypothetical protein n=1 Tax=Flavobacterium soli TaxID=344881 RepID=UPI0003FDF1B7|nr:hypothetical protein [Flavobacterium soli]